MGAVALTDFAIRSAHGMARGPAYRTTPIGTKLVALTPSESGNPTESGAGGADDTLLSGICTRDAAALSTLYDRYHRTALAVALRLVRNQQAAEDVVQEAFLAVWRQAASYTGERGSVRNWLFSIVHHRAVDWLRRRDVARPPIGLETFQEASGELPETRAPEVWEDAVRSIERERVRAALGELPAEQRQTVTLAYFGGLTCQQISERVDAPLGTVKGRMRLALQKLRQTLGPDLLAQDDAGLSRAAGRGEYAGGTA